MRIKGAHIREWFERLMPAGYELWGMAVTLDGSDNPITAPHYRNGKFTLPEDGMFDGSQLGFLVWTGDSLGAPEEHPAIPVQSAIKLWLASTRPELVMIEPPGEKRAEPIRTVVSLGGKVRS